jgi:hypothetical protein
MAIFKVEKNTGYTVMSNHHLRNINLTLKAKGLLSQMLSLPAEWDYTLAGLSYINKESIDAIRTAVWELEKEGYIIRRQGRDEKGKMTAIEYIIYEQPQNKPEFDQTQAAPELPRPVLGNPTPVDLAPKKPMLENPTSEKPSSGNLTSENPPQVIKDILNKDLSSKEISNPIPSPFPLQKPEKKNWMGTDGIDAQLICREIIKENIEYEDIIDRHSKQTVDEIIDLMLETVCTSRKTIHIAGDDYPAELVKSKFLKLNSDHIDYVFTCLKENTTKVRNIKKYLLTALFNAPSTIDNYYAAAVRHNLYGKDRLPDSTGKGRTVR